MPSTDHSDHYPHPHHHHHAQGTSSSSSLTTPPTPIQAPPITPPPLYALVTPGLHRCSAIGLEEELNEAWSRVQSIVAEGVGTSKGKGKDKDKDKESVDSSVGGSGSADGSASTSATNSTTTISPSASPSPSPTPTSSSSLPLSILSHSPLLSFLSTLHLRTLIYLSPSLLPASLLKLSRDLNLSLLQWDLQGGRVWRIRQGAEEQERAALSAFTALHQEPQQHDHHDSDSLTGLDLTKMCKATLELILNVNCNGVLLCDPSGVSETSTVIGCLRRMMRWNFASVCLEYRAFAPTRSASTANHLRFVELFPLDELQFPNWDQLVPWAARALRSVRDDKESEKDRHCTLGEQT